MKIDWKKIAPYLVALVVFIGFAVLYCSPLLEGKVLYAGDTMNWKGAAHQTQEYTAQTGESCWWTGSMFSGMPAYQIDAHIPSHKVAHGWIRNVLHLGLGETMGILFGYFLCFFILLLCFGVNPWISIAGGLAMGMSTYFFLIIPAGHVTKAIALGFLPAIIGGMHLVFKQKYWIGIPIMLIFGIASITLHPQMTYYIAMLIGVMAIAEIIIKIKDAEWKNLGISLVLCIGCLMLIAGSKVCYLKLNNEYLKETMRGGHSELTQQAQDKSAEGLDIKYATDWSYGKGETMTLLIPNWEGGASGYNVGKDSELCKALRKQGVPKREAEQFCEHAPTYHGEKAFTSGAVYVGAIVCFLFLLGLLIVPGPYKWALLFATIMSIFLAWGKNMMWLTELFFNYFPMYNKFRAVESILVVAEITMPLLGFMALQRIVSGEIEWKKLRPNILIAGGITAGICLFAALFAGSFDMTSSYDAQWKAQMPQWVYDAVLDQRVAMLKADAWRSLLFVLLGCALIFWYAWDQAKNKKSQIKNTILYAGLAALILIDMVPVNKRFFNDDNFVKQKESDAYFKIQPWEEQILQDESLDYRVLNLNTNTFNDSRTSYRLKSIGGYSAVKLRRYQDLIDEHISKMNWNVLNMLNTKYIVTRQGVYPNPDAMGNAWFVNEVLFVPTPDDESAALNTLDLTKSAVADEKFREILTCTPQSSENDKIVLTEYTPDKLTYQSAAAHDRVAIFSEIYYPHGWHLYVDGEEKEIGRVNYVLRAAVIPAGEHSIKMEFIPDALVWDKLGYTLVIIAILISLGCIGLSLRYYFASRKNEATA
ncbi:MAG: YfhO family protein [Paludibacteraceae bacterium]|nr:YfhO family protein [Paludibacteraceae bacterium]